MIDFAGKLAAGALLLGGAALAWHLLRRSRAASGDGTAPSPPSPAAPTGVSPLNAALLVAADALVPPGAGPLRPGDKALDPVYGGRLPDVEGAPAWGYYQERLAPDGRSGGTTCGVVLAYLMGRAGWPADMVNRKPSDPVAPGGGFIPGAHVSKIVGGARRASRGWYVWAPIAPGLPFAPPQVGDAYHVDHPPRPNSDHVGVVESVSAPRADGTREIVTVDGGQGASGADVARQRRTLSADARTLTLAGVPARVLGWIRAPHSNSGEGKGSIA